MLLKLGILAGLILADTSMDFVTCGSAVKLAHAPTGHRLHSHDINYGGGSGQQSVTAFGAGNDHNSYYYVYGSLDKPCERGIPIKCGEAITLKHLQTKKNLHSHLIASPLSNQQEVSAHDKPDSGDDWIVGCSSGSWKRESQITLRHRDTGRYLSANSRFQFGRPINGQLEVCAVDRASANEKWIAQEGIYVAND